MRSSSALALCLVLLLPAAPAALRAEGQASPGLPMPPAGDALRIPGLPPIQLPPGTRVFGPNGPVDPESLGPARPRGEAPRTRPPENEAKPAEAKPDPGKPADPKFKPRPAVREAAQRAGVLDELFKRLAATSDAEEGKGIAGAIERVWLRSGSDTADLLMSRAVAAVQVKDLPLSLELLDKVVAIEPDWAEGWNKRATVRFMTNDINGAMADIDRVLKLEPRHFGALSGMGFILEREGLDKRALEVFRHVLTIYPGLPDIKKIVDKLAPEVEGRDI
jgi:tetratricopeptide (TPR) repeat protein